MTKIKKIILAFVFIIFSFNYIFSQNNINELLNELNSKELQDTQQIRVLMKIADFYQTNNPQKGINYIKEAIKLSQKINNNKLLGKTFLTKGFLEYSITENFLALESYRWALKFSKKAKDSLTICDTYNNIGLVYFDVGNHQKALNYYQKSLEISEKKNLEIQLSKTYNNIGLIYYSWKLFDISLEYHFKALKIRKKLNSEKYIASSYNNIANIYSEIPKKRKIAFKYYKLALNLKLKLKNKRSIASGYNNIGYFYLIDNKLDSAIYFFNKSLIIKKEINNLKGVSSTLNNLGSAYIKKGELNKAEEYLNESLEISLSNKLIDEITDSYSLLAELNEKRDNPKLSLNYYKKYLSLKDSIFNQKKYLIISQLENRYIDENNAKKVEILEKDKKIKELEIEKFKTNKRVYLLIILLSVALLIIVVFISRYNKKFAKLMKIKNHEFELANKMLIESETKLIESNKAKDKFFSIISHDIKNSFNVILGISQVLAKKNKTIEESKKQYYNEIIYKASRNLNELLENILNWSKTQTGKLEYNPEVFKLNEIIENNIEVLKINSLEKNINIVTNIKNDVVLFSDKNMLSTIIRNLLNNSIKYSFENSIIEIKLYETPDIIKLIVKDFGVGMPKNIIDELKNGKSTISRFGTNNEKGTGLGLTIISEFLKYLNGQLQIESEVNSGTTFSIILPNKKFKSQSI